MARPSLVLPGSGYTPMAVSSRPDRGSRAPPLWTQSLALPLQGPHTEVISYGHIRPRLRHGRLCRFHAASSPCFLSCPPSLRSSSGKDSVHTGLSRQTLIGGALSAPATSPQVTRGPLGIPSSMQTPVRSCPVPWTREVSRYLGVSRAGVAHETLSGFFSWALQPAHPPGKMQPYRLPYSPHTPHYLLDLLQYTI